MRRVVIVGVVVGVLAASAGALVDRQLRSHASKGAPASRGWFRVMSNYADLPHWRLRTGALSSAPNWGAILFEAYSAVCRANDKCSKVALAPVLLTTPEPVGALRIVEHSGSGFVLRSSRGWLFSLGFEGNLDVPTLYPLGPRLDPARLPMLPRRGFAVPVTYGRGHVPQHAVVLVGSSEVYGFRFYGRLDGYALPKPSSRVGRLDRPLLGPDRALYRIDVGKRRLVRVAAPLAGRRPWEPLSAFPEKGCSWWPGSRVRYEACPGSIARVARDGSHSVVYEDRSCDALCRSQSDWGLVLPSPDGRTLLAEEGAFGCGYLFTTYFIPERGDTRTPVMTSADLGSVEGIGWLNGNEALVATDGVDDCEPNQSAIYIVDRRARQPPELVVQANGHDATLW